MKRGKEYSNQDNIVINFIRYCKEYLIIMKSFCEDDAELARLDPLLGTEMDEVKGKWAFSISNLGEDPDKYLIEFDFNNPKMEMVNKKLEEYSNIFKDRKEKIKDYLKEIGYQQGVPYDTGKKLKKSFYGINIDDNEEYSFDFTEEEVIAIKEFNKQYEGYEVHKEYATEIYKAFTAKALSNYAKEKVNKYLKKHNIEDLDKAIAAITKTYSIYQLPIFIYDLALYFDISMRTNEAKELYGKFLKKQINFQKTQVSELIVDEDYLKLAIMDAEIKTK